MLLGIKQRLEEDLRKNRGVPVAVEYGPVTPARVVELRDVVVVEYEGPDAINPRRGGGNPTPLYTITTGVKVTLHVTSRKSGARREEHEERARRILARYLLPSLDWVLRGGEHVEGDDGLELVEGTAYAYRHGPGGFEPLVDENGKRVQAGATYVLRLAIDDCATDETWSEGDFVDPTFDLGPDAINSTTKVKGEGTAGAGQTACGEG